MRFKKMVKGFDPRTFEDLIREKIRGLDQKQRIRFASRCAMRALPFLGATGDFGYWKEGDRRQRYLYAVLRALDLADDDDDDAYAAAAHAHADAAADASGYDRYEGFASPRCPSHWGKIVKRA